MNLPVHQITYVLKMVRTATSSNFSAMKQKLDYLIRSGSKTSHPPGRDCAHGIQMRPATFPAVQAPFQAWGRTEA